MDNYCFFYAPLHLLPTNSFFSIMNKVNQHFVLNFVSLFIIRNQIEMWKSDFYNYRRRPTKAVTSGTVSIGGNSPIRIQSMANTDTNDIKKSVEQCIQIIQAGGELVRFTTQGKKEVESLMQIHQRLRKQSYNTPLVADVHFNADVADYAAEVVEKVRINPGNYVRNYGQFTDTTNDMYQQEFEAIKKRFVSFLAICKQHNTAVRIGVNHGSLSQRMLSRWGNTAEGMVESCLEFLRICKEEEFSNVVISMKSSNTILMMQAVRLLTNRMETEGFYFPIHLGVTEAGDGEDGRIKSAVGIGTVLGDGIGDTIRVSLSEAPEAEIPVALFLRNYVTQRQGHPAIRLKSEKPFEIKPYTRRKSHVVKNIGGENLPVVISTAANHATLVADFTQKSESIIIGKDNTILPIISTDELHTAPTTTFFLKMEYLQLDDNIISLLKKSNNIILLLYSNHQNPVGEMRAFIHTLTAENCTTPVVLYKKYQEDDLEKLQIMAACDLGAIFSDNLADGVFIENRGSILPNDVLSIAYGILQATRVRTSKTEFISCPGCGRTLFDLQQVIARVKSRTSHLTGLKIGIMGCIVNGPGEMADADYGYVGAGKGKVSLYKKQICIEKNIPEAEAVDKLIELIKANNDWKEPAVS